MSAEPDNKKEAEMAEEISSYLKMKDYYQILGVEKDSDEQKIKNAYRKLAVRFHPDKNKLEGAKHVFHKISNAYSTLVDKQSRESYDRYGPNEQIVERENARRQQQYKNASQEMDFDEYIFRQFFGGGMAQGNGFYYQFGGRPQHNHQQQQQPQQRGGINMLHIFILVSIGMSILPKFFESAPFFSFNQTAEFPIARQTSVLKARYYAGSEFQKLVQGKPQKLLELEQKVDAEFYKHLYHECQAQTMQKRRYQQAAYNSYSDDRRAQYLQAADQVDMQSCQRLRRVQEQHYEYVMSIS